MSHPETLAPLGAQCDYHGSVTDRHGWAVIVGCYTTDAGTRYDLRYGQGATQVLLGARRESFTVLPV